jgi:hypothetical protein
MLMDRQAFHWEKRKFGKPVAAAAEFSMEG